MNSKTKLPIFILAILFVIACGATNALIFHGSSMEPTITDREKIFSKPANLEELKRGDLIYYIVLLTESENVKRLIGLPGETMEIKNGVVYINDIALDEPYVSEPASYKLETLTLRDNEYFVLGDNRNNSSDSHNLGPVTSDLIKGVIIQ